MTLEKLFGLGEISLYATKTFRYKDQYVFRYYFNTWKQISHCGKTCILLEKFFVHATAVDTAYKIAVKHLYRELNEKIDGAYLISDSLVAVGTEKYDFEHNAQHSEMIFDNKEDLDLVRKFDYFYN